MSLNGVESSGKVYSGEVKSRPPEEKVSSEKRNDRVQEDSRIQEEERRSSEPGRGENMDITA